MSHWLRVHSKVEARLLHRCRCAHAGQAMQNLCLSFSLSLSLLPFHTYPRCCATAHTWTRMPTRLISISKLCIRRTTFPTRNRFPSAKRIKTRLFFFFSFLSLKFSTNYKKKIMRNISSQFVLLPKKNTSGQSINFKDKTRTRHLCIYIRCIYIYIRLILNPVSADS